MIEEKASKFIVTLSTFKNFNEIIKLILQNTFRRVLFLNIRLLIMLKAVEKIEKDNSLSAAILSQIYNKKLKKKLNICEYHINAIWEELYKLLY